MSKMNKIEKVGKVEVDCSTLSRNQRKRLLRTRQSERTREWVQDHISPELREWAAREWAKGWEAQLAVMLRAQGGLRRNGRVAACGTLAARSSLLYSAIRTLRELGYKINNIRCLSTKHVRALLAHWRAEGAEPGSIANRLSALRALMEDLGKPGLVPGVNDLDRVGVSPAIASRHVYATRDKSWEHLPKEEIFALIEAYELRFGLIFRLADAFGMRKAETVMWCPHEHHWDTEIAILKGAKTGKERTTPISPEDEAEVRALIERCKAAVEPRDSMSGKGRYSLVQAKRRFAYIAERFGLTKLLVGVTPHGLRHGYIQRRLEDDSGGEVPVRNPDAPWPRGPESTAMRRAIMEDVGHSRTSIITAYAGAARRKNRRGRA